MWGLDPKPPASDVNSLSPPLHFDICSYATECNYTYVEVNYLTTTHKSNSKHIDNYADYAATGLAGKTGC